MKNKNNKTNLFHVFSSIEDLPHQNTLGFNSRYYRYAVCYWKEFGKSHNVKLTHTDWIIYQFLIGEQDKVNKNGKGNKFKAMSINISIRDLALYNGCSNATADKSLKRLIKTELLKKKEEEGFVLDWTSYEDFSIKGYNKANKHKENKRKRMK